MISKVLLNSNRVSIDGSGIEFQIGRSEQTDKFEMRVGINPQGKIKAVI